jgi:hypothetical protein
MIFKPYERGQEQKAMYQIEKSEMLYMEKRARNEHSPRGAIADA